MAWSRQSEPLRDVVARFFSRQEGFCREKLWLHLDKPYYGAGDRIWFRGYLLDAVTHRADTLSNYIYVELYDRSGTQLLFKKVRRDSTGFSNCLDLPAKLAAGDYVLRAYTNWMRNFDPSFFFHRTLRIGNSISDQVNSEVVYPPASSGRREAVVRFYDSGHSPYLGAKVSYTLSDRTGRKLSRGRDATSSTGGVRVALPADTLTEGGYMDLRFETDELFYERRFYLPDRSRRVSVRFFPEGGDLLAGAAQRVAFRATRPDGRSVSVSGIVTDRAGDTVALLATAHAGMGSFRIVPRAGERYAARVWGPESDTALFELPEPSASGYSLSVTVDAKFLRYRIYSPVPVAEGDSLHLVGHTRGSVAFIRRIGSGGLAGRMPVDSLRDGILHLLLVDGAGHARSERLAFVYHPDRCGHWDAATDKESYGQRDRVRLSLRLSDARGRPLQGDFSLSVTDRNAVVQDSVSDHIVSNLLLNSDLQGRVENPGWYFSGNKEAARMLDLVMLTHGWRRFDTESLRECPSLEPEYFIEHGQYISGRVIGMAGKPAIGGKVSAIGKSESQVAYGVTDSAGRFLLDVDFRDTTTFLVSAFTRKGQPVQSLEIDARPVPPFTAEGFFHDTVTVPPAMREYLDRTRERYFTEGGVRVVYEKEVVVTEQDPRRPTTLSVGGDLYDTVKMRDFKRMPLDVYIRRIHHVYRSQSMGKLMVKKIPRGDTVLTIFVNGIRRPYSWFPGSPLTIDDVKYINLVRHRDDPGWPVEDNYRLEIVLKEGRDFERNVSVVKLTGYAESVRFPSPVYETPEQVADPDLRTTLYWNPCVRTDTLGRSGVVFYTDDSGKADYELTIEGVTADGVPCRYSRPL